MTTRPRLARRARISRVWVECGGAWVFQIAFIADWTSPNTPDVATIKTTMPTTVAKVPSRGLAALSIMPCSATAVWCPIITLSWSTIAPSAASWPKARPAIATTTSSTGAIENSV